MTYRREGTAMELLSPAIGIAANAESIAPRPDNELARLHAQVASLQAERETLRWAAGHDELTSLPNRRMFYALASPLLGAGGRSAAVIVIDLDGFKPINDRHGHAVGDHVLQIVSYRLASWAGDNVVARLGGDEFAALLTAPDPRTANWWYPAIVTLSAVIAEPIDVAGRTLAVTASIGIAPAQGVARVSDLLHQADLAMYQAKRHTKLTGEPDIAACARAGGHENIPLRGQEPIAISAVNHPAPPPAPEAPQQPKVVELTLFPACGNGSPASAPDCGPFDRCPTTVVPAESYETGDMVWVHRNGAWRPGVVESVSVWAVLARYRCADGPGTGVDTMSAEFISPRMNADPQFDRGPALKRETTPSAGIELKHAA